MSKFQEQQDRIEKEKDQYLYSDISKISTETLKAGYKKFDDYNYPEIHARIEAELLARKELLVRKDFTRDGKAVEAPRKNKEATNLIKMK